MISVDRYVSLDTAKPLDKAAIRAWYSCVKQTLPSGLLCTAQTNGKDGSLKPVSLIVRQEGGKGAYMVPLTRNLTEEEGERIMAAYEAPEGLEFDISASSAYQDLVPETDAISIDDARYAQLCASWAKRQHDLWMQDRIAAGWRYGDAMSMSQRTHPMLKAWTELPVEQRGIDTDAPAKMVKLLNDEGYVIIDKAELDGIRELLRQQAQR